MELRQANVKRKRNLRLMHELDLRREILEKERIEKGLTIDEFDSGSMDLLLLSSRFERQ